MRVGEDLLVRDMPSYASEGKLIFGVNKAWKLGADTSANDEFAGYYNLPRWDEEAQKRFSEKKFPGIL